MQAFTLKQVLGSMPGASMFGQDMIFDIPYLADCFQTRKDRKEQVDKRNTQEITCRVDFGYVVIILTVDGINHRAVKKKTWVGMF